MSFQPGPENPVVQMPKVAIKGFSGNIADVDSTGHLLTTSGGGGGGSVTITAPLGSKLSAASVSVVIASDQSAVPVTGTVTATNPSVGTVGSPVPASATAIGIKDGSGNLQDVSSANPLRIDPTGTTIQPVSGTVTVVTATSTTSSSPASTSVTSTSGSVLASNAARKECTVVNTDVVVIYLGLGQVPTATAYHVALSPCASANDGTGGTYTSDIWKGAINAITASTSGHVCVTELT